VRSGHGRELGMAGQQATVVAILCVILMGSASGARAVPSREVALTQAPAPWPTLPDKKD